MIWIKETRSSLVLYGGMEKIDTLRRFGLFDLSVPRYTSYPPANHFEPDTGRKWQASWLRAIPEGEEVSVYVHIPFCRRLCWFCACRTQGTSTLNPVESYVTTLLSEIQMAHAEMPATARMGRLHLGGGTPTLLSVPLMRKLITTLFETFERSEDFEFSVEVDPTDATDEVLTTLMELGMTRASIGVQDFAQDVQDAIGRQQSVEQTRHVVDLLREQGIGGINFDVLYGLPHQTLAGFGETLNQSLAMRPDRLAIYGYAHVPWVSKRQKLIPESALPDPETRFQLAEQANRVFRLAGYRPLGIDHFALPHDGLAKAAEAGQLKRNFQGYTDDTARYLIGFGASAISRYPDGYVQNAVATSAYHQRIKTGVLPGDRGYHMSADDHVKARFVEDIMCSFGFDAHAVAADFPEAAEAIFATAIAIEEQFGEVLVRAGGTLTLKPDYHPLARIMAKQVDRFQTTTSCHSQAI